MRLDRSSDRLVVAVDRKQVEKLGIKHLVLLCKDEHDAPQVADKPSVNRLVSTVRRHEDVGYFGQKSFERELLQVGSKRILVNIDYLISHASVMLNLLIPVAHRLIVRVLNATLDVTEKQGFSPADEPFT